MIEEANLRLLRGWWVLGALLVIAAEVAVCLLLFIPQSRAWAESKQMAGAITSQLEKAERIPVILQDVESQQGEISEALTAVGLSRGVSVERVVMEAVGGALDADTVELLLLAPQVAPAGDTAVSPAERWQLRCRGEFPDLVRFLSKVQHSSGFLDADGFKAEVIEEIGVEHPARGVTLEVVLAVCSEESLAWAAEARKAEAERKAKEAAAEDEQAR